MLSEPSPTSDQQSIVRELVVAFGNHLERCPIGILYCAPLDVYLDETNVFQPDIMVIMNASRKLITKRGICGAPDFAVEILSPSNQCIDRGPKRDTYARAGVREIWLVDPATRSIERFLLAQDPVKSVRIWRQKDIISSDLFPGLTLSASKIFG